jgi:hypothetical protein
MAATWINRVKREEITGKMDKLLADYSAGYRSRGSGLKRVIMWTKTKINCVYSIHFVCGESIDFVSYLRILMRYKV